MFLRYNDPSVRLTGRFAPFEGAAVTTASGSAIEIAFEGSWIVAHFDVSGCTYPYPHLWVQIDGGAKIEAALDRFLRFETAAGGSHVLKLLLKSADESQSRWHPPLAAKLAFCGADADGPAPLPADTRKTIEFVGDSITEGILIDTEYSPYPNDMDNRCFQNDVTATYGYLTAEALNLRPSFMGYGAVGATRAGNGGVPKAAEAYPFCFDGAPIPSGDPDYILINHGANDRPFPMEDYIREYLRLLDTVRALHPTSQIISLSAFCGCHAQALGKAVARYGNGVCFLCSTGWIPEDPLHPHRDGHRVIANHLIPLLRDRFSL